MQTRVFPSLSYALAAGTLVFLVGTVLFSLRLIGGGDVKFLAAAGVVLQPRDAVTFILATLVAGGIVAVCYSLARGRFAATMANVRDLSVPLLYGVRPALEGHDLRLHALRARPSRRRRVPCALQSTGLSHEVTAMNTRRTTLLVAVLLAIGTGWLTLNYINGLQRQSAASNEQRTILVATSDIAARTTITPQMFRQVTTTANSVEPDAIADPNLTSGALALISIPAGGTLTASKVGHPVDLALPVRLSAGKRAVSVLIDKVKGVSGLVQPGDRVDVISCCRAPATKTPTAVTILRGIRVLAIGTSLENSSATPSPQEQIHHGNARSLAATGGSAGNGRREYEPSPRAAFSERADQLRAHRSAALPREYRRSPKRACSRSGCSRRLPRLRRRSRSSTRLTRRAGNPDSS